MESNDLKPYLQQAREIGAAKALVIPPKTVITAPWVRYKCQFGCWGYGQSYSCPPDTPDHRRTRDLLDSYGRAILFHFPAARQEGVKRAKPLRDRFAKVVELEGRLFKDGYYKALALLAGPCRLCEECAKLRAEPCLHGKEARPSLEACGIDVYATARGHGLPIKPLAEKSETQNNYCLILVD